MRAPFALLLALCASCLGGAAALCAQDSIFGNFSLSEQARAKAEASSAPGHLPQPKAPAQPQEASAADPKPLPEPAGKNLRMAEDRLFHVVGEDFASVQAAFFICREAESTLAPCFYMPDVVPLPLLVQLIPGNAENKKKFPYWLNEGAHSSLALSIRWDADTRLRDVCEAVCTGLLRQAVLSAYGSQKAANLPRWLAAAFGLQTYCRLQNVRMDGLQQQSARLPPMNIQDLFAGKTNNDPDRFAADSFWLLRTIEAHAPDRMLLGLYLQRLLLDPDPVSVLRQCIPDIGETPQQMQLWWEVARQQRISESPPIVWTIEHSRDFLAQSVLIPARVQEKDCLLTLPQLWPYREHPAVKIAALDRMRLMRMKTNLINPIYFNAAVSYSEALEALLAGHQAKMNEKYAQFNRDLADALALEKTVNAALDAPLAPVEAPAPEGKKQ